MGSLPSYLRGCPIQGVTSEWATPEGGIGAGGWKTNLLPAPLTFVVCGGVVTPGQLVVGYFSGLFMFFAGGFGGAFRVAIRVYCCVP